LNTFSPINSAREYLYRMTLKKLVSSQTRVSLGVSPD